MSATDTVPALVSAQQRPSLTAEITCAQRAIETMQPAGQRLIDDPYARHFVRTRRFRARMATPSLARLTRRVFDRRYPGYMAIILLRNRYHEDALAQARADGIDQIVLLGAGYDTTAFRLDFGAATVFEVDAPPTQQAKRHIATSAGLRPKGAVVYVPCDFEHDALADALALGGFDATRPCLIAWFGVSYFLTRAAVERTLADVADLSAPGSRLVWDHMDPAVIDGTTPFIGAQRARRIVTKRGEPYLCGLTSDDAATMVGAVGFDVIDQARLPELGGRYGGDDGVWCRTDDFVGVQTAQRPRCSPAMTALEELSCWASKLRLADVPDRVVAFAKSQVLSQLAAIRAGRAHPLGERVVKAFGEPLQPDAKQSACVLAGLGAWLHFDDTGFAGHLGNSTVAVPLAYAHALGLDGPRLLTAVIAANECAGRITAATTLGPFRGQNAAHTHLAAAVAGRLASERATTETWADALGLAFALPLWPLLPGFLASDAKVLSAAAPVRLGLDACDAAIAGLAGPRDVIEHPEGFLARFATVPLPGTLTAGLGRRWHTETLSFKVHPGGPGLDAALDVAVRLHGQLRGAGADAIDEIVVEASYYTVAVDERVRPFVNGPRSPVSALVFSVPYTVASALLTGGLSGADFTTPRLDDPARWAVARKVRVAHDLAMTRRSLLCDVPFGAALRDAGPRAAEWLESVGGQWLVDLVGELGPPAASFEASEKVTGARLTVRLRGGAVLTGEQLIPIGAIGPDTRRRHPALVREKFLRTGGAAEVADAVAHLDTASAPAVARIVERALSLA